MYFKYLGRLLTATDYEWSEVIVNLHKAHKSWSCLSRILGREGADPITSGHFYLAVVQAVLLVGVEMLVVTPHIERLLVIFHNLVVRRLMGIEPRRRTDGRWY